MSASKESALRFDVVNDTWLEVLKLNGTTASVTLRELLGTAHLISRISEPSPLTEVALLRFLIALVSDGLRATLRAEDDWARFAEQCRDGLPTLVIDAILAPLAGRSDVLDANHDAFFDGPAVKRVSGWDDPSVWQPVSRFLPELPTGTNLAHFAHTSDDLAALCVGCLLKSRAVDAAFARSGLGPSLSRNLLGTISGAEPRYVMLSGDTLAQTLLLNAVVGDRTRPSWVSVHRAKDGDPGPIARMSWRPRLVMPVTSSESRLPCVRCGTTKRPRFTKAVMLDTCQVADAISTHPVDIETDYFTTVDDLDTGTGAAHVGESNFASAVFYHNLVVDFDELLRNLGGQIPKGREDDPELLEIAAEASGIAKKAIEGLLRAVMQNVPSGKINSHAHNQQPSLILVEVKQQKLATNYLTAFHDPARRGEREDGSIETVLTDSSRKLLAFARYRDRKMKTEGTHRFLFINDQETEDAVNRLRESLKEGSSSPLNRRSTNCLSNATRSPHACGGEPRMLGRAHAIGVEVPTHVGVNRGF